MSHEDVWGAGTEGVVEDVRSFGVLLVVVREVDHGLRELIALTPS